MPEWWRGVTRTRLIKWALRVCIDLAIIGSAMSVLVLYAEGDANRFWAIVGAWLSLVPLVVGKWLEHRLEVMTRPRRLTALQIDKLKQLLSTAPFQDQKNLVLQVAAVKDDPEAKAFALEFLNLFKACGVNVYPTPNGIEPNEALQVAPSTYGLGLDVCPNAVDAASFKDLCRCLTEIGLPTLGRVDKNLHSNRHLAMLTVLNRPEP